MVLLAGLLGSCTASDNLPEASVDTALENGDFVMDPNMHYLVNGVVTNDKDLIKKSLTNAWNTHFDYSKNKVVISTNSTEFEKYQSVDKDFAVRFNEKSVNIDKSTNDARVAATNVPNHNDRLVFYYEFSGLFDLFHIFHVYPVDDTSVGISNVFYLTTGASTHSFANLVLENIFSKCTVTSSDHVLHLKNNDHLNSKTLTLYRYKNQSTGAATRSFTVAKNAGLRMYANNFRFSDGVYAKSYK